MWLWTAADSCEKPKWSTVSDDQAGTGGQTLQVSTRRCCRALGQVQHGRDVRFAAGPGELLCSCPVDNIEAPPVDAAPGALQGSCVTPQIPGKARVTYLGNTGRSCPRRIGSQEGEPTRPPTHAVSCHAWPAPPSTLPPALAPHCIVRPQNLRRHLDRLAHGGRERPSGNASGATLVIPVVRPSVFLVGDSLSDSFRLQTRS